MYCICQEGFVGSSCEIEIPELAEEDLLFGIYIF